MTELESLQKTSLIWHWLALNPEMDKDDAYKALNLNKDLCLCPCCEYALVTLNSTCDDCPLITLWPGIGKNFYTDPCCNFSSPYTKWDQATNLLSRTTHALQIAHHADKLIKELTS